MYVLIFLTFTKRNNFYLSKAKFPTLRSQFYLSSRVVHSFVHESGSRYSFANAEAKRFREGLRQFAQVCNILALNLFEVSCSSRYVLFSPEKFTLKTVTTCSRLIRPVVASCAGSNSVSTVYLACTLSR